MITYAGMKVTNLNLKSGKNLKTFNPAYGLCLLYIYGMFSHAALYRIGLCQSHTEADKGHQ